MLHELSLNVMISDSKKGSRLRQQRKYELDLQLDDLLQEHLVDQSKEQEIGSNDNGKGSINPR